MNLLWTRMLAVCLFLGVVLRRKCRLLKNAQFGNLVAATGRQGACDSGDI